MLLPSSSTCNVIWWWNATFFCSVWLISVSPYWWCMRVHVGGVWVSLYLFSSPLSYLSPLFFSTQILSKIKRCPTFFLCQIPSSLFWLIFVLCWIFLVDFFLISSFIIMFTGNWTPWLFLVLLLWGNSKLIT